MTGKVFADYIRLKTKTNATTLTDTNLLLLANIVLDQLSAEVITLDEGYLGVPQTTDIHDGQREYPFPENMIMHLKKVEAVLNPTQLDQNGNPVWTDLHEFDLNQYSAMTGSVFQRDSTDAQVDFSPTTDEPKIQAVFGNVPGKAAYMIFRNSLWIFSGALTGYLPGNNYLKIWAYEWPIFITAAQLANSTADLGDDPSSTTAGLPRILHQVWADMVVVLWKQSTDKQYQPDDYEQGIDLRKRTALQKLLGVNQDRSFTLTQPNGGHLWSDGFNL